MKDPDASKPLPGAAELSPGVSYYLRKLLRQNLDRLLLPADSVLETAVNPLDLLNALTRSSESPPSLRPIIRQLEQLTQTHQQLSNQGLTQRQTLRHTEAQIFKLLGLSLKDRPQQATVLVVDDTPDNLRLLSTALSQHGYTVRSAINGALALSSAQVIKPDLILLDIMMPGLNGYEVCERLKANPQTSDIPIIFLSALDDAFDKVKAFGIGGADYITKPFQIEEVLVRIEHQLKLWTLQQRLEAQNIRLQHEIADRQRSEARSRSLFEKAVSGFYQIGPDGHFLSVSPGLAVLYGYDSADQLIASVTAQTLYVNPGRHAELVHRLHVEGAIANFESPIYRQNRSQLWISETVRAVRDSLDHLLYYEGAVHDISARKTAEAGWKRGRRRTKQLLLTLFPKAIAQQIAKRPTELLVSQSAQTTILVADVLNLTPLIDTLAPAAFINHLSRIFRAFDRLAQAQGVEPIKTWSTRYLAAAGVPTADLHHAAAVANLALAMQQTFHDYTDPACQLRIGIHSGPAIAGTTRRRKLSYDLWGATVNQAHWLEQNSLPGKIHVSQETYEHLKDHYLLEHRKNSLSQNTRPLPTYWLTSHR
jgi:PAS domain S-box-containing protein